MFYRNENGFPSLLVEDGHTVTISTRNAAEAGVPVFKVRPRNTAALLTLAGQVHESSPRLSDSGAFEQIESSEGLVSFSELDADGNIDGYSVSFIKSVLHGFNPQDRMPPKLIKSSIPVKIQKKGCECSSHEHHGEDAGSDALLKSSNAAIRYKNRAGIRTHSMRETYVPDFLSSLRVYSLFTRLGDIVIGRNATLVLDSDLYFAIADNVLAYHGSRLVQRAGILNLDITGTLRGSVTRIIHQASDILKIDWKELSMQAATKS